MLDVLPLSGGQLDTIASLRAAFNANAPLQREARTFAGGIAFKRVNGIDYLVRYVSDPETRKKKFHSLGRRSPETEQHLQNWIEARRRYKEQIARSSDHLALQGRMAKALRLARLPTKVTDFFQRLAKTGLVPEDLCACGATALYAYELETGLVATPATMKRADFDIELVSCLPVQPLEDALHELLGSACLLQDDDGEIQAETDSLRVGVRVVDVQFLQESPGSMLAIGRNSQPIMMPVVHRTDWFALEEKLLASGEVSQARSEFMLQTTPDQQKSLRISF